MIPTRVGTGGAGRMLKSKVYSGPGAGSGELERLHNATSFTGPR